MIITAKEKYSVLRTCVHLWTWEHSPTEAQLGQNSGKQTAKKGLAGTKALAGLEDLEES
jgi:hypothetical protein